MIGRKCIDKQENGDCDCRRLELVFVYSGRFFSFWEVTNDVDESWVIFGNKSCFFDQKVKWFGHSLYMTYKILKGSKESNNRVIVLETRGLINPWSLNCLRCQIATRVRHKYALVHNLCIRSYTYETM